MKEAPKKSQTSSNLKAKDKNLSDPKNETKKYSVNANPIFTNKGKESKSKPAVPRQPQK